MSDQAYELHMLEQMEPYELRLYLVQEELALARYDLSAIEQQLSQAHSDEDFYIRMGKKYLEYYNKDTLEEDWLAAEQYMELAKGIKEYRRWLRTLVADATEVVRRYKKEWVQVNKMLKLQQSMDKRPQKN